MAMTRQHALTDQQLRQYDKDGFVILPGYFDAATVAQLRQAAADLEASVGPIEPDNPFVQVDPIGDGYRVRQAWPTIELSPVFRSLSEDPRIIEPMRSLFDGREPVLFEDKLNYKQPGGGSRFAMHQDYSYWTKYCQSLVTAFIYLDEGTEENGCLQVVPGRHKEGLFATETVRISAIKTNSHAVPAAAVDPSTAVKATGPAGTMLIFSSTTPHQSSENLSDKPRRAYILTYYPEGDGNRFREDQLEWSTDTRAEWVKKYNLPWS